ncbi:MAG: flavodoxin family protein [Deltaproteobacteria bacterium]|nr:flavodoxin family protein [Deltaproteobacteria bacterium]
MKALVLDGSLEGDPLTPVAVLGMASALAERGDDVELVKLRELAIAPCAGCFGCWTHTPGECVIGDGAVDVLRSYVKSDIVVYVTPVTFGGYSSQLKKMLDRFIPLLDPRFSVVGGEVHHRLRYLKYPKTIGFGTLPSPDPEAVQVFAGLAVRNGLNMHQTVETDVLVGTADPVLARRSAERLLDRAGVRA